MELLAIQSHVLNASLISLVNSIALNYFSEYYTVCVIKMESDSVLLDVPIPSIVITVDSNFSHTFQVSVDDGCQAFIVSGGAILPFLDAFIDIHDISDQRSVNKKMMILLDDHSLPFLNDVLLHSSIKELPNTVMLVPDHPNEEIYLYTSKMFNNGTRSTFSVQLEPIRGSNFFPDKFVDMHGIPVHLCTLMYPPYSYYEETVQEKANAQYRASFKDDIPLFLDGTEVLLLLEFCHKHNCTVEVSFDETNLWGTAYDNRTGNGLIGSVVERKADVALAALYYRTQSYKFATYTQPISRSGVTVLVPKPRTLPPWRTPFLSFCLSLWLAVLMAFVVGVMAVWFIGKVRFNILRPKEAPVTLSDSLLTMVGFYTVQSARMPIDLSACVILFASLLYAGFMVSQSYSSGLAGVMTVPQYENSIDTIVDLADSGMPWGSNVDSWIFSILTAPQTYMKKLVKAYRIVEKDSLVQHAKKHDMGFVGERTEFHHFVPVDFIDTETSNMMHLLKDDLLWETVTALVSKTCPFIHKFNDLILQVKQSGIQNYWELQAADHYLHASIQMTIMNARLPKSGDNFIKLRVSHFLGAYMILGVGLALAFIVFLVEISRSNEA